MKLTAHPLADHVLDDKQPALPIDQQLVLRLRVSLARLLLRGNKLATTFYAMLFQRQPALRVLFPQELQKQQAKLVQMLAWVVMHLDRREKLIPALRALGERHTQYGAKPEHYPIVRDTLIDAMRITAGDDWTDELTEDWRLSLDLIARHMQGATSTAPR